MAYTRWNLRSLMAVIVIMAVIFGLASFQAEELADREKQLALEDCSGSGAAGCCERVKLNHQMCFDYNYQPGTKYSKRQFSRSQYRRCLEIGPVAWQEERQASLAESREVLPEVRP